MLIFRLECGHEIYIDARLTLFVVGDPAPCPECGFERAVVGIDPLAGVKVKGREA